MAKRPTIDKSFIREQHGKEFVLVAGLYELGHRRGWCGCDTEVDRQFSNPEKEFYVVRAVGRFKNEDTGGEDIFTGWGDAGPGNSQMKGAYLRHAETRAVARMLRMATNVGMTAFEEMGPDAEETTAGNGAAHSGVQQQGRARRDPPAVGQQSRARGSSAPVVAAPSNGGTAAGPLAAGADAGEMAPVGQFWCAGCGEKIRGTDKRDAAAVAELSRDLYGEELCIRCVHEKQTLAGANVPAGKIA